MICQILASHIASIVELGNLGQLLWRDPLKQDSNPIIQHASDPCDGAGIWFLGFRGNLVSKASIEYCSIFPHASSGTENEWSEGCQLNFVDPLPIQAPIDSFTMGLTGRDEKPLVG